MPLLHVFFHYYTLVACIKVPFLMIRDGIEVFAIDRDPENKDGRGDDGSRADMQMSVETVGLLDLGGEPWLFTAERAVVLPMPLGAMHFAGRITGVHDAWKADVTKSNPQVQLTLANQLKRCRIFTKSMPLDCQHSLRDIGNATNATVTCHTPIEVWKGTQTCKQGFSTALVTGFTNGPDAPKKKTRLKNAPTPVRPPRGGCFCFFYLSHESCDNKRV